LKDELIKIGAKVVSHGRYVAFQMAEVAIPRQMFQEILRLIAELRPQPRPALATSDLPANPENRYHPRQFGAHPGNPGIMDDR
jgi:hypothetical protein